MDNSRALPRSMRLRSPLDFKDVFNKGAAARGRRIVLFTRENGLDHGRIGFSISKSNVKRATARNKVRRIIRELWRKEFAPRFKGRDLVVVVKNMSGLSRPLINKEARDMFGKVAGNV